MKKVLFYISVLILASGCQALKFDRYAGVEQKEIPESYRGKYEAFNKTFGPDTTVVWVGKTSYTQIDKEKTEIYFLDSTHVFSVYKGSDFLSIKEEDGRWTSFYVRKNNNDILLTPIVVEGKIKHKHTFLKKYFSEVDTVSGKSNLQDKTSYNVKMNEEELVNYLKKIKKQNLTLKKVPF